MGVALTVRPNIAGETALEVASRIGDPEMVQIFRGYGGNAKANDGAIELAILPQAPRTPPVSFPIDHFSGSLYDGIVSGR